MPEATHLQHHITHGSIQVVVEDRYIPAYWAHPQTGGPFPGLVLLHDDRGLTAHVRGLVNRFAEMGYYVAAPDLFEGLRPLSQAEANEAENQFITTGVTKAIATLEALQSHHKCNSKMALVGWDFGGTLAFHLAVQQAPAMAFVAYYGNPHHYLGQFANATVPIMAIFGGSDEIAVQSEEHLKHEFLQTGKPHELIVYAGVGHGFCNDTLETYHESAAEDAWIRTQAFLSAHQGKPPAPRPSGTFKHGQIY